MSSLISRRQQYQPVNDVMKIQWDNVCEIISALFCLNVLSKQQPLLLPSSSLRLAHYFDVQQKTATLTVSCLVAKLCLTLETSNDCSPLGSSVHGISQAIILEWIGISFFRGSSQPRDETHVSCIGRRILHHCATWKAHINCTYILFPQLDVHSLKGRVSS